MAQITGSSTTDWSGISLAQVNFETDIVKFASRVYQIVTELVNFEVTPVFVNSTTFVGDLFSGGRLTLTGSGFGDVLNSFNFKNPPDGTGEVIRFTGTLDGIGNDVLTSATIGSTGFSETLKGNITISPNWPFDSANYSGTLTSLVAKIGSTAATLSGNFSLTGDLVNASLAGTVTGISVGSGANTIKMTGLSLSLDGLEAALASGDLATVNDLFSFVGNQMPGNDTITYTNNSSVGMTFFGGAGHDTITISGPNADTLNGGDGNDNLNGGAGDDTLLGGDGNDVFLIGAAADHGVGEVIDGGAGSDVIRFTSTSTGQTLVLAPGVTALESVVIGTAAGVTTGLTALNVDASAVGSGLFLTGNAGANRLTGTSTNDTMNGGAGNDTLIGGTGQDTVTSGTGNDLIVMLVTAGDVDLADGGAGSDTLALGGAVGGDGIVVVNLAAGAGDQVTSIGGAPDALVQNNFEHLDASGLGSSVIAAGSAGANTIIGSDGNDQLTGNAGNDTLDGGAGNDMLNGGDGNDVILIGNASDHGVTEVIDGGAGTDVIRFTSTTDGDELFLRAQVTAVESVVIGNALGLTTGTTRLDVNAISVGYGLSLTGNAGDNQLVGTDFNDMLNGGGGDDSLYGGLGINTLIGGTGVDLLDGSGGTNTLIGGAGNDTYVVDSSTDVVIEALNAGTDLVASFMETYTLGLNVENLNLVGNNSQNGTGNALNNIIYGNDSSNQLSGLAGNDTLTGDCGEDIVSGQAGNDLIVMLVTAGDVDLADGGAGSDTLALVGAVGGDGIVVVNLAAGAGDQITFSDDTLVQNNFENLDASGLGAGGSVTVTGSAGANSIIGSNGNDQLTGNVGNDTLDGGAGDDTLNGGDGNDVFLIGAATEHGGGEVIDGGAGADVFRFNSTTDNETLTLNATVTGVERVVIGTAAGLTTGTTALNVDASAVGNGLSLIGNAGDNVLTGTSANDILNGGAGNDTLNGAGGINTLIGGTGNDRYVVNTANDLVSEALNAGIDTVVASLTTYTLTANLDNLDLAGAALTGTGNALNNIITGNDADNTLSGLAGNDTLIGDTGQDTVTSGTGNDLIVMLVTAGDVDLADGGAGSDTLALVGAVGGDGIVVVNLAAGAGDQITFSDDTLVQNNFENLDASGLGAGGSVTVTGSAGANSIIGSSGNDSINGGAGNDILTGGAGDDTMIGGVGVDNLLGGTGDDQFFIGSTLEFAAGEIVDGGDGTDTLRYTGNAAATLTLTNLVTNIEQVEIANAAGDSTGIAAINVNAAAVAKGLFIIGNNGANRLTGTSQADTLTGNDGNDQLSGGAGNDTLNGGAGADALTGGAGRDLFAYNVASDSTPLAMDVITEFTQGDDQIDLRPLGLTDLTFGGLTPTALGVWYQQSGDNTFVLADVNGNTTADLKIQLNGSLNLNNADFLGVSLFTESADTVNFNSVIGGTYIDGTQYDALGGDDLVTLPSDAAAALAAGFDPTQTFHGGTGHDTINGGGLADILEGGEGNDFLDGGLGADSMTGGQGDDTYVVDNLGDSVAENLNEGTDLVQSSVSYTLGANLENLTLTGAGAIPGTGNVLNNILTGNGAANVLDGQGGADQMSGGAGNDTYLVDDAGDTVTENPNSGIDLVKSSVSFTLGDNLENLTLTGLLAINGTGNDLDNVLTGNPVENLLDGESGSDTMVGGGGSDTYIVDDVGDVIVEESPNFGIDLAQSSVSYVLPENVENLTLIGDANINGTGNDLFNMLTGNSGDNVLTAQGIFGGFQGDFMYGEAGVDTLIGAAGADLLDGGAGADFMHGGPGDDLFVVENIGDAVFENPGEGIDTVDSEQSFVLSANVEDLRLTGKANIDGTGNDLDNSLFGNSGNNVLTGGAGNDLLANDFGGLDTLIGGQGNDTYFVTNAGVIVVENPGEGIDLVRSQVSYALGNNVENLTLIGFDSINGTGNDLDNVLTGDFHNNILDGGAGNDTLHAGGGLDTLIGGQGDDTFTLAGNATDVVVMEHTGEGTDLVWSAAVNYLLPANVENLTLIEGFVIDGTGNDLANILTGNDLANVLAGGAGNDRLVGQLGNDTYQVNRGDGQDTISENDSTPGNSDTLLYGATINPLDLVFSRQANDLRLAIHGSTDQVTIQNWYSTPGTAQVETIQAGNGQTLLSTHVDQLIQAMAQFTTDTGLSWNAAIDGGGTPQQQSQFQGILAANWQ